jgi:DNA invertase Pin-like site-specific DNA recombinase
VSFDKKGREKSHDEQHSENGPAAKRHGITPAKRAAYRETGSASRYSKRKRDDWPRMMAELRGGTFGADVLIMWESSRGSRKVGEWVELLDVAEEQSKLIFVTTHDRIYNPANPRDRRSMLEDAVDSEYESSKTSLRVTRDHLAAAEAGRPVGICPFGYQRVVDPITRELSQIEHPEQADQYRAAVADYLAGVRSLSQISRDIGRSVSGVRNMLRHPLYCGVRTHKGKEYPAAWPALITKQQHRQLVRMLERGEVGPRKSPARVYPYTGLLRCSECGAKLTSRKPSATDSMRRYVCPRPGCHKVATRADELDAWLEHQLDLIIVGSLAAMGDPSDSVAPNVVTLRQEQHRLAQRAEEILAEFNAERITMAEYQSMRDANAKAKDRVDGELEELATDLDTSKLVDAEGRPFTMAELTQEERGALAAHLLTAVTVHPAGRHKVADWPKQVKLHKRRS